MGKKKDLLTEAKEKLAQAKYISYDETGIWPNPLIGIVDTVNRQNEFSENDQSLIGYDFISISKEYYDLTFLKREEKVFGHEDKVVEIYTQDQFEDEEAFKKRILNGSDTEWSPVILLQQKWKYKKDTTINELVYGDYFLVDTDSVQRGIKVYIEHHLLIN
ncbi:hypothetical protein R9C00_06200 [Flammeovirgaceae bacterium SG7u.111]|nr:hypothetical protein [Flammeovirgaceae bacterium SG7u.132]WPO37033.1 hypothetical protein R9C00_06200 [Flammeovirgaceae bacterium SG7u.111]